jgi:DNA-directed RNA polymerase specialized sigma24 family protein
MSPRAANKDVLMHVITLHRLDRWDGGDRQVPTPYHFRKKEVAEEIAGPNDRVARVDLIVCESVQEMKQAEDADKIRRALTQLSSGDRETLGLPADLGKAIEVIQQRKQVEEDTQA